MKKKTKIWLGIILVIILVGVSGIMYLDKKEAKEHAILVQIVKENRNVVIDDIKTYDKYQKIKKVTFEYDTVELNPANGIMVKAYVNDQKKLKFNDQLYTDSDDGIYKSAGVGISAALDDYMEEQ